MGIYAKVIQDSISEWGSRLTTMEVNIHRFVLAELNTHRAFSRNSASSRAIPFAKQVDAVLHDPAIPVSFPAEQPGMSGGEEVEPRQLAEDIWLRGRDLAVQNARRLQGLGVHKSVVNRMLEPFMWHRVIISATDWGGFFEQRCSPLAQPEMRVAAEHMRDAYKGSTPTEMKVGMWHTPYVDETNLYWRDRLKVSTARCARVSFLTHEGTRDLGKDLDLFDRLVSADPPHWSPLEHVATPAAPYSGPTPGNFTGWHQLRHNLHALS